jgi:hypothetical protein
MSSRTLFATSIVAVAAVSLITAGCSSSSSSTTKAITTATQNGALAYARCMRFHGVANFPDPASSGGDDKQAVASALQRVSTSEAETAQTACIHVNDGTPGTGQSPARGQAHTGAMLAFARCMRRHGLPNFPDPTSQGQLSPQTVTAAGIDLHQPGLLRSGLACTSVTHGILTRAAVERAVNGG